MNEHMDVDIDDLEMEQMEYIKRNADTLSVPDEENMYPDPLKKPLDTPIILDSEQEKKLVDKIKKQLPYRTVEPEVRKSFSFSRYIDILSTSFVDIMDDLLNFNGDMESLPSIFTKDDRMILVGTIVMVISIIFLMSKKPETGVVFPPLQPVII